MDDAGLVGRALDGDESAFELIVRRYTEDMWRLARTIVRDDHYAEEAVQDAFWRAHRNLGSWRGDASLKAWLLGICYRAAVDQGRRKRHVVVSLDEARTRAAERDHTDLRMALEHAVNELPIDQRRAFHLVHVLGYTREEAASIAGVAASTMRSRAAKACERLASHLAEPAIGSNGG